MKNSVLLLITTAFIPSRYGQKKILSMLSRSNYQTPWV